ncbi:MAG: translation initiation factor, partial [Chloroflexota bacterium]|nr:translation initiation factor [Chloroflexota bacterium]
STDGGPALRPAPEKGAGAASAAARRKGSGKSSSGPAIPAAPDDGWIRLWRVKGGRGGKTATVITGVPGSAPEVEALAVELRRAVGAGGSIRGGAIEIQGDHRQRLQQHLAELGYRVKLAGG